MSVKPRTNFRRSSHRSDWNRPNSETDENTQDKVGLSRNFSESHGNVNKPPMHEAYTVTFVEQPNSFSLDFCENKLYHKLNVQINIQNMILPRLRYFFCFPSAERWCISVLRCVGVSHFSRPVRIARWPIFHRSGRYFAANLAKAGKKPVLFENRCLKPVFWK